MARPSSSYDVVILGSGMAGLAGAASKNDHGHENLTSCWQRSLEGGHPPRSFSITVRQLRSRNSFDRLLCCPAQAERGRKRRSVSAKLTMPSLLIGLAGLARNAIPLLTITTETRERADPYWVRHPLRLYAAENNAFMDRH